eukprot:6481331-Amphidinium_carterae.1
MRGPLQVLGSLCMMGSLISRGDAAALQPQVFLRGAIAAPMNVSPLDALGNAVALSTVQPPQIAMPGHAVLPPPA